MWASNGLKLNSPAGSRLADTGPLPDMGTRTITLLVWASDELTMSIRRRDAADANDLQAQRLVILGSETIQELPISVAANERVIVTVDVAQVGQAQASLFVS